MKKFFNGFVEFIFILAYIATIVLAVLDIFGVANFIDYNQWMKILVMLFGTIGIAILWDKRKIENDIVPQINKIKNNQNDIIGHEKNTNDTVHDIKKVLENKMEVQCFQNKTQFYLFLSETLLKLPSGAEIDVTNFEKNYNISYDIGEDEHIETFMKKWTEAVKTGRISVRQLVHITSPQDYADLNDRISQFKYNRNFTISAITGLPIVPYGDIMILNQEYVVVGLSNDISSPNNLSFGYAIKSKELALNFRNYFNIYWASQFSIIIKDKDEIKKRNLNNIKAYTYDIDHNLDLKKYNQLILGIYHISDKNINILKLLENLNRLYRNVCYDIMQKDVEEKLNKFYEAINNKMCSFLEFNREYAAKIISKMIFNAKEKICAVSLDIGDNEFWVSEEGKEVFQANIDVVSRKKVNIERIFVCTLDKKLDLQDIISSQSKAGITLFYTEYKKGMGVVFEDFLIIDNEALLVLSEDLIKISINQKEIENYLQKFEHIKHMGNKITS